MSDQATIRAVSKQSGRLPAASAAVVGSVLVLGLACGAARSGFAAQGRPSESDVKAAYLFNFGKFVRRPAPATPEPSFDICLLGHDELAPSLTQTTSHEQIDGAPVRIRQLDRAANARSCAIVFMGASEETRLDQDLQSLQTSNVLTVSDIPTFLERGGMIQFLLEHDRVRFAVNLQAVKHTRLELSSELIRVAAYIFGAPRGEVTP